ncbi:MAG: thiamine-binding protein [Chitinophagaceae bacterium]|nr:thiamine-binding protein [Chitinophagaceae bacterium]
MVNASIQLIRNQGLKMEVGPFGTAVEGTREQIEALLRHLNEQMEAAGCPEWLLQTQWHIRTGAAVTIAEKTERHR